MRLPVGLPPTHLDKHVFGVCGMTQTDRFKPFRTPKWVGPLEMPLSSPSQIKQRKFLRKDSRDADGKPCPANLFIMAAPSTNGLMENFVVSSERRTELVDL
jgi:hypothetical protein